MRLTRLLLIVILQPALGAQDSAASAPAPASTTFSTSAPQPAGAITAPALPSLTVAVTTLMSRSDCQPRFPAPLPVTPATTVTQPAASGLISLTFGMPQPADWLILGIDDATVRSAVVDTGEDLGTKPLPDTGRRYGRTRRADWLYHDVFMGMAGPHAGELRYGTCTIAGPLAPAARFTSLALQTTLLVASKAELHKDTLILVPGLSVQITDVPGVQLVVTPTLSAGVRLLTTLHSLPLIVALDFFDARHQVLGPISSSRSDRGTLDLRFSETPATAEVTCLTQAHHATVTMSFDGLALSGQNAAAVIGPKPIDSITLGGVVDLQSEITKVLGVETTTRTMPPAAAGSAPPQALHNTNF